MRKWWKKLKVGDLIILGQNLDLWKLPGDVVCPESKGIVKRSSLVLVLEVLPFSNEKGTCDVNCLTEDGRVGYLILNEFQNPSVFYDEWTAVR
jgi:hypothetical protein